MQRQTLVFSNTVFNANEDGGLSMFRVLMFRKHEELAMIDAAVIQSRNFPICM